MTSKKQKLQAMEDNAGKVRFRRWNAMSFGSKLSIIVLGIIALSAIFAPLLAPHDPQAITMKGLEPSGENLFGTDHLGRDVLSRLLYGGRYSLLVGLASTGIALAIAVILGSIAAVSRKGMDELIMRIMDVIMSVPAIALAAVTVVVFRDPSNPESLIWVIIGSIAFVYIPQLTRIVRANVLSEYGKDYVNAVVVAGARAPWVLARHVMRNCAAPVLVFATLLVADAIILEASLTFIGAGLQEPIATWGNILSAAQPGVLRGEWWQALFPGVMIMLTVLCLNIVSEGITDAMVAAPTGPAKTKPSKNVEREEDKLLADSVAAHEAQKESLDKRIADLMRVEGLRDDRQAPPEESPVLLEVKNLCIKFPRHGDVNVVDNVSFTVRKGETMALVGESGCGKSITAFAIMGLIDPKAEVTGEALYEGRDLLSMPKKERQALLGHELAMVYQDALSSLNPGMLIKAQMKQLTSRGGTRSAEELMQLVGLDPKRTLESYPHELSGGQRQRVNIARALMAEPALLLADEPTSALDSSLSQEIMALIAKLTCEMNTATVMVTHDRRLLDYVDQAVEVRDGRVANADARVSH